MYLTADPPTQEAVLLCSAISSGLSLVIFLTWFTWRKLLVPNVTDVSGGDLLKVTVPVGISLHQSSIRALSRQHLLPRFDPHAHSPRSSLNQDCYYDLGRDKFDLECDPSGLQQDECDRGVRLMLEGGTPDQLESGVLHGQFTCATCGSATPPTPTPALRGALADLDLVSHCTAALGWTDTLVDELWTGE